MLVNLVTKSTYIQLGGLKIKSFLNIYEIIHNWRWNEDFEIYRTKFKMAYYYDQSVEQWQLKAGNSVVGICLIFVYLKSYRLYIL